MKYDNINPLLTTELLESVGFKFDGYYYSSNTCPIKLLKSADGYEPIIEGSVEKLPQLTQYCQLIQMMAGAANGYLQLKLQELQKSGLKQINGDVLVQILQTYWGFDTNISFSVQPGPHGVALQPANEYTISLLTGGIKDFNISFIQGSEIKQIRIQCAPQYMTFDYANRVIASIIGVEEVHTEITFTII